MRHLLAPVLLATFACTDGGATVARAPHAAEDGQVSLDGGEPSDPADQHLMVEGPDAAADQPLPSGEGQTDAPPDGGANVVPEPKPTPNDPCRDAPPDFACNGYSFSLTLVRGHEDVRNGYGHLDEYPGRHFDVDRLVRRECLPVDEAKVVRGFSHVVTSISADGENVSTLASKVSITGLVTPEVQQFAEHSRPSSSRATYSYAERHRGPFSRFDAVDPAFAVDSACGESFVFLVGTSASLGMVVEIDFPTPASRDAFRKVAGDNGVRRVLYGIGADIGTATSALAESGAKVSLHVATTPALASKVDPLLRGSHCSVRDFTACTATFNGIFDAYWAEVAREQSSVWQVSDVGFRGFATPREQATGASF